MKKLSVLIPVYNTKAAPLMEAVFSISKQNQSIELDYDIVLVNDGSTNSETIEALQLLKKHYDCTILSLNENSGTSAALNYGHEHIKSEYVAISGSSDISFPDRLKIQMDHLRENPEIDVLGTNLFLFNSNDPRRTPTHTVKHAYIRTLKDSSEGWLTNHGTVIYKNAVVKEIGGYDLNYRRGQDVNLWKRMFLAGKIIRTLPDILYAWRRNET